MPKDQQPSTTRGAMTAMQGSSRTPIYLFFGVHMLMFGLTGFYLAYSQDGPDVLFQYMFGGFAIFVYLVFYVVIFGIDQIRWLLINSALGILGIYAQIGWILDRFDKDIDAYPWHVHVIPFLYYVLYTFLLRQCLLDVTGSRDNPRRRAWVERVYVAGSLLLYAWMLLRAKDVA